MTVARRTRAQLRGRGLFAAFSCALIAGTAMGLAFPLVSIGLEYMTGSGVVVGFNAFIGAAATVICTLVTPRMFALGPPRRVVAAMALVAATSFAAFPLFENVYAWFALRLIFGVAITFLFIGSEIWINQLAPNARRGRILGVYSAVLAGGFGLGSLLFGAVHANIAVGFVAGALVVAASVPILYARTPRILQTRPDHASLRGIWSAAALVPSAVAAAFAFGAIETATLNFLPVWAVRAGFGAAGAAVIMAVGAFGNILLQVPIGWTSDVIGRKRTLAVCAVFGLILPLALVAAPANLALVAALAFFYSGFTVGMYTVGLAQMGGSVPRARISQANAAFLLFYGLGSTASPQAAGFMIDAFDPEGILYTLAALAAAYLVFAAATARRG